MSGNTFSSNTAFGIFIDKSNLNVISDNIISSNTPWGIYLNSTINSIVKGNNFIRNQYQAGATEDCANAWDDGYLLGGNYWSDYTGIDAKNGPTQSLTGSDGIGDTQYLISASNVDHYPLMAARSHEP